VTLTANDDFVTVYVSIDGVEGYYSVTVPATTLLALVLVFAAEVPQNAFDLLYQVASSDGAVGTPDDVPTDVVEVGTGEVQVSVSWDTPTDVDLHVVDPSDEEIYYGNALSASGGELDLDSNAACAIDGTNNENITWNDTAPSGQYIVRVDYWSACSVTTATSYTVTVRIEGRAPQTFTGTFQAADADAGGLGAGRQITTFTH
jgi:hypothetical protein